MQSVDYLSDDDVMQGGIRQHDDKRMNCIRTIQTKYDEVCTELNHMASSNPSALRVKVMDTTVLRLVKDYCKALITLIRRFKKATNERDGKDAFREDIVKIESDMHIIIAAGWKGYPNIVPAGGFVPADTLDASAGGSTLNFDMPSIDPSTPRRLRSRKRHVVEGSLQCRSCRKKVVM